MGTPNAEKLLPVPAGTDPGGLAARWSSTRTAGRSSVIRRASNLIQPSPLPEPTLPRLLRTSSPRSGRCTSGEPPDRDRLDAPLVGVSYLELQVVMRP